MRCFFDPSQLAHQPDVELHNGSWTAHAECAQRASAILAGLGGASAARDHGIDPILRVHDGDYVAFLQNAFADWVDSGRPGEAIGYAWPVVGRRPLDLSRIDARLGRFSFDASTPIGEGSWQAAYWSAQTALTALAAILEDGEANAFALCRPPGHHCGADYLGGYCYLNNAAIAAQAAVDRGRTVAILDIDYHHGNGTQDIFYERGDMLFVSIHADPKTDYPFFWGHGDERGSGPGEGANLNLPLARGARLAEYLPALERACAAVAQSAPDLVVLSFGADTFEGDPISSFQIATADFTTIARRIAALGIATLIVMEGGYAVDALGANVAAFLRGFEGGGE